MQNSENKLYKLQFLSYKVLIRNRYLTLTLLTWRIWWAPNNASRCQMGYNSPFKGLRVAHYLYTKVWIFF